MSMCIVVSCVVGGGCLLWPVHSLGKICSLCPASFCTPRPNLPVAPGFLLMHSKPYNEKDIFFFNVSSRRSWMVIEPFNFRFFGITRWGIDLDYCDIEGLPWKWTEIILSYLGLHPSTAFRTLVDYEGYSIPSKGFLPAVVDIMGIWSKLVHSCPF